MHHILKEFCTCESIPCSPECKIVGKILLDHPLTYALTANADVPAVYLQQFWQTVHKLKHRLVDDQVRSSQQSCTQENMEYSKAQHSCYISQCFRTWIRVDQLEQSIELCRILCGGPSDTPVCYLCMYEQCGNILIHGTCLKCNSGARNSFTYDPIPEYFNEVQIIPNPPPQSYFNIYLCQICESNSHYGYECSQRVSLVYEPEPWYNPNFSDNDYSHDLPGVNPLIDHHCCYKCGNSLNDFFCHKCTYEFCGNDAHYIQKKEEEKRIDEEQAAKAQNWKLLVCYDDDDDEERSNSLKDNIISGLPPCAAITPISLTDEPVDSLKMGDEH
nr:hypothetical protein [Tanacetum cinerariifolium]